MNLQKAKLCLDCEELYTGLRCPKCASIFYVYIAGWVNLGQEAIKQIVKEFDENTTKTI